MVRAPAPIAKPAPQRMAAATPAQINQVQQRVQQNLARPLQMPLRSNTPIAAQPVQRAPLVRQMPVQTSQPQTGGSALQRQVMSTAIPQTGGSALQRQIVATAPVARAPLVQQPVERPVGNAPMQVQTPLAAPIPQSIPQSIPQPIPQPVAQTAPRAPLGASLTVDQQALEKQWLASHPITQGAGGSFTPAQEQAWLERAPTSQARDQFMAQRMQPLTFSVLLPPGMKNIFANYGDGPATGTAPQTTGDQWMAATITPYLDNGQWLHGRPTFTSLPNYQPTGMNALQTVTNPASPG